MVDPVHERLIFMGSMKEGIYIYIYQSHGSYGHQTFQLPQMEVLSLTRLFLARLYIYRSIDVVDFYGKLAGKYISPMDPMGRKNHLKFNNENAQDSHVFEMFFYNSILGIYIYKYQSHGSVMGFWV